LIEVGASFSFTLSSSIETTCSKLYQQNSLSIPERLFALDRKSVIKITGSAIQIYRYCYIFLLHAFNNTFYFKSFLKHIGAQEKTKINIAFKLFALLPCLCNYVFSYTTC